MDIEIKLGRAFKWAAVAICFVFHSPAHADFTGNLELLPPGCEASGECRLGSDFGFVDQAGMGWQAAKGLVTDGATIPPWAKPFIGEAFEPRFIKAAVIHDHYCDRHVRPWRQTHKVFHEALLQSGVSAVQAGIMYYAVMIGGPKWAKLVQGKPCPVGMGCINKVDLSADIRASSMNLSAESGLIVQRAAEYDSKRFKDLMDVGVPKLMADGNSLTAEKVEALANAFMKDDFYYKNGSEIGTTISVKIDIQ